MRRLWQVLPAVELVEGAAAQERERHLPWERIGGEERVRDDRRAEGHRRAHGECLEARVDAQRGPFALLAVELRARQLQHAPDPFRARVAVAQRDAQHKLLVGDHVQVQRVEVHPVQAHLEVEEAAIEAERGGARARQREEVRRADQALQTEDTLADYVVDDLLDVAAHVGARPPLLGEELEDVDVRLLDVRLLQHMREHRCRVESAPTRPVAVEGSRESKD
eukprot:3318613-Prymnesium_polylepis.1